MMLRSVRPLGRVSRWIPAAAYELTHELTHTLGMPRSQIVSQARARAGRVFVLRYSGNVTLPGFWCDAGGMCVARRDQFGSGAHTHTHTQTPNNRSARVFRISYANLHATPNSRSIA